MSVLEILRQVRSHLEDDTLAEVIEELVDVQRVARREENALAWAGGAAPSGTRDLKDAKTLLEELAA